MEISPLHIFQFESVSRAKALVMGDGLQIEPSTAMPRVETT
jgi:hypothetical protein